MQKVMASETNCAAVCEERVANHRVRHRTARHKGSRQGLLQKPLEVDYLRYFFARSLSE